MVKKRNTFTDAQKEAYRRAKIIAYYQDKRRRAKEEAAKAANAAASAKKKKEKKPEFLNFDPNEALRRGLERTYSNIPDDDDL